MQNNYYKNLVFQELFILTKTDYFNYTEQDTSIVYNILRADPYFIELVMPPIKLHADMDSDGCKLLDLPSPKIVFVKKEFIDQDEMNFDRLQNRDNPLHLYNEKELFKLIPFMFRTKRPFSFRQDYILFSDIVFSYCVFDLIGSSIINIKANRGNIDFIKDLDNIVLFVVPNKNKVVVVDLKREIPIMTNGKHEIQNKDKFTYSICGTFLSYSIHHKIGSDMSDQSNRNYGYTEIILFGLFDLYEGKTIYNKKQGIKTEEDGTRYIYDSWEV